MEDAYLYPGDAVAPIEVGYRCRDYLLSEVMRHWGYIIEEVGCEPHYARSPYDDYCFHYIIMLVHLSGGKCMVLAPVNYYRVDSPPRCYPQFELKETVSVLERYADLTIRYYYSPDGVVKRPVWVSTEVIREFCLKNPDNKELLPPKVKLVSGHDPNPICTELIEGSLIEPDLVLYDDIVNRLKKSPFIDYAE